MTGRPRRTHAVVECFSIVSCPFSLIFKDQECLRLKVSTRSKVGSCRSLWVDELKENICTCRVDYFSISLIHLFFQTYLNTISTDVRLIHPPRPTDARSSDVPAPTENMYPDNTATSNSRCNGWDRHHKCLFPAAHAPHPRLASRS